MLISSFLYSVYPSYLCCVFWWVSFNCLLFWNVHLHRFWFTISSVLFVVARFGLSALISSNGRNINNFFLFLPSSLTPISFPFPFAVTVAVYSDISLPRTFFNIGTMNCKHSDDTMTHELICWLWLRWHFIWNIHIFCRLSLSGRKKTEINWKQKCKMRNCGIAELWKGINDRRRIQHLTFLWNWMKDNFSTIWRLT